MMLNKTGVVSKRQPLFELSSFALVLIGFKPEFNYKNNALSLMSVNYFYWADCIG
jgi:hypothetical protein